MNQKIKEVTEGEHFCKKCDVRLDFDSNVFKENYSHLKSLFYPNYNPTTGNGYFTCPKCNRLYLIKNYACEVSER